MILRTTHSFLISFDNGSDRHSSVRHVSHWITKDAVFHRVYTVRDPVQGHCCRSLEKQNTWRGCIFLSNLHKIFPVFLSHSTEHGCPFSVIYTFTNFETMCFDSQYISTLRFLCIVLFAADQHDMTGNSYLDIFCLHTTSK